MTDSSKSKVASDPPYHCAACGGTYGIVTETGRMLCHDCGHEQPENASG